MQNYFYGTRIQDPNFKKLASTILRSLTLAVNLKEINNFNYHITLLYLGSINPLELNNNYSERNFKPHIAIVKCKNENIKSLDNKTVDEINMKIKSESMVTHVNTIELMALSISSKFYDTISRFNLKQNKL